VLGDGFIELALFEQLGDGADRETEGCHGGAKTKGLLNGAGGAHFVVAQTDAEATRFTVAALAGTALCKGFREPNI
jgi:hypothetical protein